LIELSKYPSILVLASSVASCLIAQTLKIFINLLRLRKLDLSILMKTGGMPSSHSAMVTSLATGIAIVDSFSSTQFALAITFALIVMYDATGVRRSVGIQATILNKMIAELSTENPQLKLARIKEFLGHTPFEVVAGACLGVLIGFGFCRVAGLI
jgi:uncharacterized protein